MPSLVFVATRRPQHFSRGTLSDTSIVCDWDGVDETDLDQHPTCVHGATCPGHKAEDLLPFEWLLRDLSDDAPQPGVGGRLSNAQLYGE